MPANTQLVTQPAPAVTASGGKTRLPLHTWSLELARRWNGGTYSVFVLHGNIFDVFPVQNGPAINFVPLKKFLVQRLFPERACTLFYDIGDGLTFGSSEMQRRFFEWLEVYDNVENTNFHQQGPPRDFTRLAPLLRRFFLKIAEERKEWKGITLIVDFPEKLIPASDQAGSSLDERMNLVTLLKWACSSDLRQSDVGILLVTESAAELHADLLQNPHVAQVRIDLPDAEDRAQFLGSGWAETLADGKPLAAWSDFSAAELE